MTAARRDQYATHQLQGSRTEQCDATATRALPNGSRAYALLDGIGSTPEVRTWTRAMARRLAVLGARLGDAAAAVETLQGEIKADPDRAHYRVNENACAALVVHTGDELRVAWCGDVRAYLLNNGEAQLLTRDHNLRQVLRDAGYADPPNHTRNQVTQHLGFWGHEDSTVGHVTVPATGRLVLACDGVYEPLEDSGEDLAQWFANGSPANAARRLTHGAVRSAGPYADNATALVADLTA